jgi:hypothetical protein
VPKLREHDDIRRFEIQTANTLNVRRAELITSLGWAENNPVYCDKHHY